MYARRAERPFPVLVSCLLALVAFTGAGCLSAGEVACGPENCGGCCDLDGICQSSSTAHCGLGGGQCVSCSGDQTCGTSGACTTDPGGGGGANACERSEECTEYACRCANGAIWDSRYCLNGSCQDASATCAKACEDDGGVSGGGGGNTTEKIWGCLLSKYSNDFEATVQFHGAADSQATARTIATQQCSDADFASWFCDEAAFTCAEEDDVSWSCTFSKYSSSQERDVRFFGSGRGRAGARSAAVAACLADGNWRGWFCTSGAFSCEKD